MNLATQQADAIEVYDTRYTLDNLDLDTEYVIRVFGLNSLGAGSPSDIVTVRTGDIIDPPTEQPSTGKFNWTTSFEIHTPPSRGIFIPNVL